MMAKDMREFFGRCVQRWGRGRPCFILLLAGLACSPAIPLHAQVRQYRFTNFSVENGLSGFRDYAVVQDSTGFIWIGTFSGLDRYDGTTFKTFKNDDSDSTSLSSNFPHKLFVDAQGTLWVGTVADGLNRYVPASNSFVRYQFNARDSTSISANEISALCETRRPDGLRNETSLWIGTKGGGLNKFISSTTTFVRFRHSANNAQSLCNDNITALAAGRDGRLWIGTPNGLDVFDEQSGRFHHIKHDSLSDTPITSLLADHDGFVWIGTANGLNRFDPKSGKFTFHRSSTRSANSLSDNSINAIIEHDARFLWVATSNGLNRLDRSNGQWTRFFKTQANATSLAENFVRSLCIDRSGNLWAATDGGVSKLSARVNQFRHYALTTNPQESQVVTTVLADESNRVWLGTEAMGIRVFDPKTESVNSLAKSPSNSHGIESGWVYVLYDDSRGSIWAGLYVDPPVLARYDKKTKRFKHYTSDILPMALIMDRNGLLWVGGFTDGFKVFDPEKERFLDKSEEPAWSTTTKRRVVDFCETRDGLIWVGTEDDGLIAINYETGDVSQFRKEPGNTNSLSNNRIYAIHEDAAERLWVATGTGLDCIDRKTGIFAHYATRDERGTPNFIRMLEDVRGFLWLSTLQSGLFRFDMRKGTFQQYIASEGLQSNQFQFAAARLRSGEFVFGGDKGFNIFHPDSILDNPVTPAIVITDFRLLSGPQGPRQLALPTSTSSFSYDENYFTVAFAGLEFTCPEKNRFKYKLDPIDSTWIDAGSLRSITYGSLADNNYTFNLIASNNDGIWNSQPFSFPITIKPPFWRTPWFVAAMVLVLASLIAAAYNYRIRQLLNVERLRVRIASDLHDDVGSSLSGIALMSDLVRSHLPEGTKDHKHLNTLSASARSAADSLRDIVWVINPEHDGMEDIVLRMKSVAEVLLSKSRYTFVAPSNALTDVIDMEFRRNLLLIYREALNNTAKYARAENVTITLSVTGEMLTLRIRDDGVGFDLDEAQHKGGNGLRTQQYRAEKIGGTIDFESTPGKGTTTTLVARIPRSRYGRYRGLRVFSKQRENHR